MHIYTNTPTPKEKKNLNLKQCLQNEHWVCFLLPVYRWVFHSAVMLGPFLWVLHSLNINITNRSFFFQSIIERGSNIQRWSPCTDTFKIFSTFCLMYSRDAICSLINTDFLRKRIIIGGNCKSCSFKRWHLYTYVLLCLLSKGLSSQREVTAWSANYIYWAPVVSHFLGWASAVDSIP